MSPGNEKSFTFRKKMHFRTLGVLESAHVKPLLLPSFEEKGVSIFCGEHGPFKKVDGVPSFRSVLPLFDLSVITLELKLYRRPANLVIIDTVLGTR